MKREWFAPWGWAFRPVSWPGWILTLVAMSFCAQVFFVVDHRSHSVADTLYNFFPYVVPTLLVLERIASRTSRSG
jgi:hypothetical protein